MNADRPGYLSRREREIMNVIYRLVEARVSEVRDHIDDDSTYDTIRVTMGILVKKGHLVRFRDGRRYVYRSTISKEKAAHEAVRDLMATFFSGTPSKAVHAILDESAEKLTRKELDAIKARIDEESQP